MKFFAAAIAALAVAFPHHSAHAQIHAPKNWEFNFPPAASEIMRDVHSFHNFLLIVITVITVVVLALIVYCIVRFRESANPVPSKVAHNAKLETIWTIVPVLILIVLSVPSYRILEHQLVLPDQNSLVVKATGNQWYWTYEYIGDNSFEYDSLMLPKDELKPGQPYLLAVDAPMVVPVGTPVTMQIAASDVLHAWTVPAFGVKVDAVPGRLNETWFTADKPGVFYGQCSELCGTRHAFMPIEVHALQPTQYRQWLAAAQLAVANGDPPPPPR